MIHRDIICLSTHYWDERRFRKQEFMSRFAATNRVLFVEPSVSIARAPERHLRSVATNRSLFSRLERRDEHLFLLKPPKGLPLWTRPPVSRLNYQWFGRAVTQAAGRLGFKRPVLWVYRPEYASALGRIPHERLVFDLVDDLPAYFADPRQRAYMARCVSFLADRADLLVVTAETLRDKFGDKAARVAHVPNGFDARVFSRSFSSEEDASAVLDGLRRPLLGFVGTLFSFIDYDLLEGVADARPDATLVLVGPVESGTSPRIARLLSRPNVVHLGPQDRHAIPALIQQFDVCLNPFIEGELADSVSPLKVYEYLAVGRPVVSSRMRSLEREGISDVISFASGPKEFAVRVNTAISRDSAAEVARRKRAAEPYSWDRLFERLEKAAAAALGECTGERSRDGE